MQEFIVLWFIITAKAFVGCLGVIAASYIYVRIAERRNDDKD